MKLSKDDTDTNIIQHEANILRPLKHPGIIEAFGYDSRVGVLFLEAGWKSGISMAESGLTELDIYRYVFLRRQLYFIQSWSRFV